MDSIIRLVLIVSMLFKIGDAYSDPVDVILSHNGPVVLGANITITAKLIDFLNQAPTGEFAFEWHDNAPHQHRDQLLETNSTVQWNISYPSNYYSAREYRVTVVVYKKKILFIPVARGEISFNITETLNGEMHIEQDDWKEKDFFVSNASPVKHHIVLSQPDHSFIAKNATSVLTFWFVDCVYYGYSTDFSFVFNYTEEKTYTVETLMLASFDEPPLIPTTTTTSTTTTTTTTTSTTTPATPFASSSSSSNPRNEILPIPSSKTNESSSGENASSEQIPLVTNSTVIEKLSSVAEKTLTPSVSMDSLSTNEVKIPTVLTSMISNETLNLQKRQVEDSANFIMNRNLTFYNNILSKECLNKTFIPFDPNKTYGYFHTQITAKVPITKVNVKGNNWLQFGDILNLSISCNGSARFQHCSKIKVGVHNVTGDETCSSPLDGDVCNFTLTHYFREANTYTYIIIIMNDVSKVVTPAVIRMYKFTVQPQLSVIVVPVTCSLVAIIIIVFGVAYYVQSQNRFTVEVADFDFGQGNDMEYKSFYERLREDISNMFNRSGDFLDQRNKYDNIEES